MKEKRLLRKEDGSILIVALIMLVLLTIMGISATSTTDIEIQIAGNDMRYKEVFFRAEAGSMENVQVLDNLANQGTQVIDPDYITATPWLNLMTDLPDSADITNANNWTGANSQASSVDPNTRYLTINQGVIAGDSLDITRPRVYSFRVVGRGTGSTGGVSVVEMGYRRAF
jgi:Tfp pilus assembly protein PilX